MYMYMYVCVCIYIYIYIYTYVDIRRRLRQTWMKGGQSSRNDWHSRSWNSGTRAPLSGATRRSCFLLLLNLLL